MFKRYSLPGRRLRPAGHPLAEGHQGAAARCATSTTTATDIVPTILDVLRPRDARRSSTAYEQIPLPACRCATASTTPTRRRTKETPVLRDARHARHLARRLEGGRRARADSAARATSTRTRGSSTTSTRTAPRRTTSPTEHPEKLEGADRRLVRGGRARTTSCRSTTAPPSRSSTIARPQPEPPRTRYIYYPGHAPGPGGRRGQHPRPVVQDPRRGRDRRARRRGRDLRPRLALRRPRAVHQGPEAATTSTTSSASRPSSSSSRRRARRPGKHVARHGVRQGGHGEHGESHRHDASCTSTTRSSPRARCATQLGKFTLCGDGLCVGCDSGDPVSSEYAPPFAVHRRHDPRRSRSTSATTQYLDLEQEAAAAFARE